jgi:hypothetical protein
MVECPKETHNTVRLFFSSSEGTSGQHSLALLAGTSVNRAPVRCVRKIEGRLHKRHFDLVYIVPALFFGSKNTCNVTT